MYVKKILILTGLGLALNTSGAMAQEQVNENNPAQVDAVQFKLKICL